MCGIAGQFNFDPQHSVDPLAVRRMTDSLVHRGPDDEGFFVRRHVGLGMRRLSIIDLADGRQPISNEDGTVHVVFNGEIYNYRELKSRLISAGHRFRTHSDTEVIVHAYEEYGLRSLEMFNGMFAFALWDEPRRQLLVARDRLGIKPLYYHVDSRRFLFGSELRALLTDATLPRELDLDAVDALLTFEYVPAPSTILKGVRKLPAGHLAIINRDHVQIQKYWDADYTNVMSGGERELEEGLVDRLRAAVQRQLVSDVPLGAFLSGGVDSSLVVALMCERLGDNVQTFSIGFSDGGYDERDAARLVARHLHTRHEELIVNPNDRGLIERAIRSLDEPLADDSIVPTLVVSELARRHVKVALSGDGGDELFAGYDSYRADRIATWYGRLPRAVRGGVIEPLVRRLPQTTRRFGLVNAAKGLIKGIEKPDWMAHARWLTYLTYEERGRLYQPAFAARVSQADPYLHLRRHFAASASADRLGQALYVDLKSYLVDDVLAKVDRMSMAVSLEVRPPLLDHELVEYAAALPSALKLRGLTSKHVLKRVAARFLPESVVRRRKSGFAMPVKNWLRRELKPLLSDVIEDGYVTRHLGLFEVDRIRELVREHDAMRANHSHLLWTLIVLELWCQEHLGARQPAQLRPADDARSSGPSIQLQATC
jgi:asparagine synthase (glutamine-hydrolysing)